MSVAVLVLGIALQLAVVADQPALAADAAHIRGHKVR